MLVQSIKGENHKSFGTIPTRVSVFYLLVRWLQNRYRRARESIGSRPTNWTIAYFEQKRNLADRHRNPVDALSSLPLCEKQRLGMHGYLR